MASFNIKRRLISIIYFCIKWTTKVNVFYYYTYFIDSIIKEALKWNNECWKTVLKWNEHNYNNNNNNGKARIIIDRNRLWFSKNFIHDEYYKWSLYRIV